MSNYKDSTICDNHCDNPGVTIEGSIPCPNSSPCDLCIELANIENTLTGHQMKLSELKRNINLNRSPFIRLIPPEIIARISEFANTDVTFMGSLPAVILLSSVCSDWRRAVVETPQLWTSIKIDLPSVSKTSNKATNMLLRLATFIDEWLGRSGQLPLSISICSDPKISWVQNTLLSKEYRPIFKILDQYSSRWHNINISIVPTLLPFLQPDCLPQLEQLHITYEPEDSHDIAFPPTPRLNTVEIQLFPKSRLIIIQSRNIGIQWHTVTHVSLESITSRHCLELLRLNPQLVHCTFNSVYEDDVDQLLEPPILSSLTYLSMHHRQPNSSLFLDNIELPCLETLVLSNVIVDSIINFIERSACPLQTLSLVNWQILKTGKLIPLLQCLSTLTKLAISSPIRETKDNYLSLLIRIYTSQSESVENDFLPHLEVFEYREDSDSEFPSTLESSILSKRDYSKPVTSISLRSAYISMANIINKEVPCGLSVILQHLKYGSCTILKVLGLGLNGGRIIQERILPYDTVLYHQES